MSYEEEKQDRKIERLEAEIERLRKENLELQVAVLGPDSIRAHQAGIIEKQATRIQELESQIARLGRLAFMGDAPPGKIIDHFVWWGDSTFDALQKDKARIKELEGALVEERARPFSGWVEESRVVWDVVRQQFWVDKIDSGDHIPDVTKKVWRITDERKAALEHILICHHCRYDDSGCKAPDVLRVMLVGAGQ